MCIRDRPNNNVFRQGALDAAVALKKSRTPIGRIKKLIKQLHRQGVKLTILSANETTLIKAALLRTGILRYFDSIFCGKSAENAKDNPQSFEKARERLGTPKEETLVVDDSLYAIRTAASAGFPCVAVVDGEEAPEVRAELEELALFCVSDFHELLDKLEGPNA